MNEDNCFLLLGKTGVGKSTLTKILSENPNVVVGHSLNSQTQETKCYNCEIDNFKYSLIDTPGYDDSNGNDDKNYGHIKKFLTSEIYKIKGVVLMFSFQEARFGDSHIKGLEKIVSLIPLKNFWEYITIIFTKTFCGDEDELQEEKENKLNEFNKTFDVIISAFNKSKDIDKTSFDKIKKVFVDLRIKKTKKNQLSDITSIFKKSAKYEPLFHKVDISENWEEIFLLNDKNSEIGDLIKVKLKTYNYYNLKGVIIKKLSKPIQKEFVKQLTKKEYESKFLNKNTILLLSMAPLLLNIPLIFIYNLTKGYSLSSSLINALPFHFIAHNNVNEKKIVEELSIDENF